MKFVQAFITLGLFGWLGYAVFTDTLPLGDGGGSSKTNGLKTLIDNAIGQFGPDMTALGLFGFGVLLALFFVSRQT